MPLIELTDRAVAKVQGFREGVEDAEAQAMWVEVTGVHRGGLGKQGSREPPARDAPGDAVDHVAGLAAVVPAPEPEALAGGRIDRSAARPRDGVGSRTRD